MTKAVQRIELDRVQHNSNYVGRSSVFRGRKVSLWTHCKRCIEKQKVVAFIIGIASSLLGLGLFISGFCLGTWGFTLGGVPVLLIGASLIWLSRSTKTRNIEKPQALPQQAAPLAAITVQTPTSLPILPVEPPQSDPEPLVTRSAPSTPTGSRHRSILRPAGTLRIDTKRRISWGNVKQKGFDKTQPPEEILQHDSLTTPLPPVTPSPVVVAKVHSSNHQS